MLDPNYILWLTDEAQGIASQLHADVMKRIVRRIEARLKRGDNYHLTSYDKYQIEVLQEAGYLLEDIQEEIRHYTGLMKEEIQADMEEAGIKNIHTDDKTYKAAGIEPGDWKESPVYISIIDAASKQTNGRFQNYTRTFAQASQKAFIDQMDRAYWKTVSGDVGYTQAYTEAIDELTNKGINFITYYRKDENGDIKQHLDSIETATLRCIRTGVTQTANEITKRRMSEFDWDIVLVSAHYGARYGDGGENYTNHEWWQGKFYSLSGTDTRFPPFDVCGEGDVQGIGGANCRHTYGAGDGVNNPYTDIVDNLTSEENRRIYDEQQGQRALERQIRKQKTKVASISGCQDETLKMLYESRAYRLKMLEEKYRRYCDSHDLRPQEIRKKVGAFDKAEAQKAARAAREYMKKLAEKQEQDNA